MSEVSPADIESTRKIAERIRSEVGTAISRFTQARAADFMATSASTVNRVIADDLDRVCHLLAAVGLQVAPLDAVVVDREDLQAFKRMAFKYLQSDLESGGRGV